MDGQPATLAELIADLDTEGTIRAGKTGAADMLPPVSSNGTPSAPLALPANAPDRDLLAKRVRGWIARTPGAISGQGGHSATFAVTQTLVNGFLVSRDEAIGYLLADYNPKCDPAWSLRDLEHKVDEAIAKPCDKQRGWMLANDAPPWHADIVDAPLPPSVGHGNAAVIAPIVPIETPEPTTTIRRNECDDDPHRLARCLIEGCYTNRKRRTLIYWRGEFHQWTGTKYETVSETEFRGTANQAVWRKLDHLHRRQLDAYDPSKGSDLPKMVKVTRPLVSNVVGAMEGVCAIRGVKEAPAWLPNHDGHKIDSREIVAAQNGLVQLSAYARRDPTAVIPHTPFYLSFNALDFPVSQDAHPPTEWLKFLEQLWPGDAQSVSLLQEWFGYLLTSDTRMQKMLLLVGPPRAGKGTIVNVLRSLVGERNCVGPTLSSFGLPFGLTPLLDKTLAVIEDARLSGRSDAALIAERLLTISGEGELTIDRKYLESVTSKLKTRFVVVTNEIPQLSDASGALASRWCVLHLTQSFIGREDLSLSSRLLAELPSIFNWAVAGWARLQAARRFTCPESSTELVDDIADIGSPVGEFVKERCIIIKTARVEKEELYTSWKKWCEETGKKEPGTLSGFGRNLRAYVPSLKNVRGKSVEGRVQLYVGLRLRVDGELLFHDEDDQDREVRVGQGDPPIVREAQNLDDIQIEPQLRNCPDPALTPDPIQNRFL